MGATERICIVTDEISQDLAEVREFLDEHRVGAVELRCVGGTRVPKVAPGDLKTLRTWAADGNPRILSVSPGTFKCRADDAAGIERQITEVFPRSVDLAVELGATFLVTFGFDNPDGGSPPESALDALRSAADLCADANLPLLVENEPGFLAGSAAEIETLLVAASHENLFVNWDPLNGNRFTTPELTADLVLLYPRIRHVHVKNGVLGEGERFARCCPLRGGDIDWRSHLRLLRDLGYEGHLGVETHFEPVREGSVVVLRELREMQKALDAEGSRA